MPRATVIIPTHDHDETLPMAVDSARAQTISHIEVMILGDGVTPEVRGVAEGLVAADHRVRFLDLPKGEHHGESSRDTAVREAASDAIFYLCDDDLLLPRHVENLLALLVTCDLVQCRNGFIDTSGELVLYPTDLSLPEAIEWHLRTPRRNAVSLTGTAHTRSSYLLLDEGWTTTPVGEWPDHYMWKKFLRRDGVRAATHPEMTAVQLPTSAGREQVQQRERAAELRWWAERLQQPHAHDWLQAQVSAVTSRQLDRTHRLQVDATLALRREREQLSREREAHGAALAAADERLRALQSRYAALSGRFDVQRARLRRIQRSRSWRLTSPLRRLTSLLRPSRSPP